jgi:DNA polymerase III delta prime subunit
MSAVPTVKALFKATPHLAIMGTSLFWTYLTLGGKVRKARKAFEKQLVSQGMSKEDAKRLSACYNDLKNSITNMLRRQVTVNFERP